MKNVKANIVYPVIWVGVFLLISFLIGQVTQVNMDWYATLEKSPLTPPNYAFPIAWTTLYVMLAVAGSLLWQDKTLLRERGLFSGYMAMNWAWSFLFFYARMITTGFVWIVISNIVLAVLIVTLWRKKNYLIAGLVAPTLLWSIFAAYLNGYISVVQ